MVNEIGQKPLVSVGDASSRGFDMGEDEISRLTDELEQLDAEREALFHSCPPPVLGNAAQSQTFFTKLNSITARYVALEQRLRKARMDMISIPSANRRERRRSH